MKPYDLRSACRAARRWAVLAVGALSLPAFGYELADYPIRSEFGANQTLNQATHYTKGWTAAADGVSGVKVGANFTMKAPGGRAVNASILNTMSRAQAARILARGLAGATWLGVGFAAYDIYDAVRVRENPTGAGLSLDPGTNPTGGGTVSQVDPEVWCEVRSGNTYTGGCTVGLTGGDYASAASTILEAQRVAHNSANPVVGAFQGGRTAPTEFIAAQVAVDDSGSIIVTRQGNWPNRQCTSYNPNLGCNTTMVNVGFSVRVFGVCPLNTGGTRPTHTRISNLVYKCNGTFTVAATCPGGVAPYYDGKCATGTFTVPITPEEAEARRALMETAMPSAQPQIAALAAAVGDIFQRTPVNIEALDGTPQVQDVANVAGGTTKVTNPDGSSVQTATAWDFKPYGLTKGFGYATSGAWDEQTTTTTCPGGGSQCTTTTTTTENDPQGGAQGDDPERDFCMDFPERAGCVKLGDMPTDAVPRTTLALAYSTESISLPSGCPPDVALPRGQVFSYSQACDAATLARPLVIAAAAITALWICVAAVGGTRGSA